MNLIVTFTLDTFLVSIESSLFIMKRLSPYENNQIHPLAFHISMLMIKNLKII